MTPEADDSEPVSHDTVLVQFVAEMLPHDSPEFKERAARPWKRPAYLEPIDPPADADPDQPATNN